jgi:large subunit ribosomal protein L11
MVEKKIISVLVTGGEATAGAPLGPALGPLGVNVLNVVNRINEVTSGFKGMRVPVKVEVDTEAKTFEVNVGLPTSSALIAKEAGIEKGAAKPKTDVVGNVTFDKVVSIAKAKMPGSYAKELKSAVKEVIGSCVSMGVTVDGKDPREFMREVQEGKWDAKIQ